MPVHRRGNDRRSEVVVDLAGARGYARRGSLPHAVAMNPKANTRRDFFNFSALAGTSLYLPGSHAEDIGRRYGRNERLNVAKVSHSNLDHEDEDAPILKLYSRKQVRQMFRQFSDVTIVMNRFPTRTIKRGGLRAWLYNHALVPFSSAIPKAVIRPFGFHINVVAVK